jgi:hypothetical protein
VGRPLSTRNGQLSVAEMMSRQNFIGHNSNNHSVNANSTNVHPPMYNAEQVIKQRNAARLNEFKEFGEN